MGWQVQLSGDRVALQSLAESSYGTLVRISATAAEFLLESSEFDGLTDPHEVRTKAHTLVAHLSGASRLLLGADEGIIVGNVALLGPEGTPQWFIFPERMIITTRVLPPTIVLHAADGTVEVHRPGDPIHKLISLATTEPAVAQVLRLLDRRQDWGNLYKIYEVIQNDSKGSIAKNAWGSSKVLERFTRTANHQDSVGDEARHATNRTVPPKNPMTLGEAKRLIEDISQKWLFAKLP